MNNIKNLLALLISVVAVVVAFFYFLAPFPELEGFIGTKSDFDSKARTTQDLNNSKETMVREIESVGATVQALEKDLEKSNEAAQKTEELFGNVLEGLNADDWTLHIPSLLIELEEAAIERDVKIAIIYDTLNSSGDYVSSSGQGLKMVEAKVELRGNYSDVQSYIKMIEDIDFINVEELVLNRVGNGVLEGNYVLQIYHID